MQCIFVYRRDEDNPGIESEVTKPGIDYIQDFTQISIKF